MKMFKEQNTDLHKHKKPIGEIVHFECNRIENVLHTKKEGNNKNFDFVCGQTKLKKKKQNLL